MVERAEDVLDLVLATLRGKIKPVMSVYDCRQIQMYPTTHQPMRALVDRIKAMEGKDGILSISIVHCFPYADVPEIGTRVLVIADGDKAKADALATKLGEELVSLRGKTMPQFSTCAGGVAAGVAFNGLPVVLADPADNAGGGAPSDNTDILRHLIERKVENAASARSGIRSRSGSASMPGRARRSRSASAARSGPSSGRRSMRGEVVGLARDCLAELRADPGSARRLRRRARRRRRGRADHQPHAGARARALHQSRHRSDAEEDRRRQVDQPLHGGLRADRQEGDLRRIERAAARDYRKIPYTQVQRPIWPLDENAKPSRRRTSS